MNTACGAASAIKFAIHLVRRKNLSPLLGFLFLPHAGPGVGINRIDACDRRMRIREQFDLRAGLFRNLASRRQRSADCGAYPFGVAMRIEDPRHAQVSNRECATLFPSPTYASVIFLQIAEPLLQA